MYNYTYHDNHIIMDLDGKKCLLDTGSPFSFGDGTLRIAGKDHQLNGRSVHGFDLDEMAERVGIALDALIGSDILSQYPGLFIDFSNQEIHFDKQLDEAGVPLEFFNNIPIVSLKINNQEMRAYVDTGAKQSYIDKDFVVDFPRIGEVEDFYPGFGKMTVSLVKCSYKEPGQDDQSYELSFGILPTGLEHLLEMADCHAILGMDWFRNHDKSQLTVNYKKGKFSNE